VVERAPHPTRQPCRRQTRTAARRRALEAVFKLWNCRKKAQKAQKGVVFFASFVLFCGQLKRVNDRFVYFPNSFLISGARPKHLTLYSIKPAAAHRPALDFSTLYRKS
jgi:hypothetical protein